MTPQGKNFSNLFRRATAVRGEIPKAAQWPYPNPRRALFAITTTTSNLIQKNIEIILSK